MSVVHGVGPEPWNLIQWPTPRAANWARGLPDDPNVRAVVAIGSAARQRARPTSDIDLIVVCKDVRRKTRAPLEVDARWMETSNVLVSAEKSGDDVIAWGLIYGSPLYDPEGIWRDLIAKLRGRLPLPTPAVCSQRAERARRYASALIESGDEEAASEQVLTMLTHEARLALCTRGVFPASRPELVEQLESIGASELAELLGRALEGAVAPGDALHTARRIADVVPVAGSAGVRMTRR